jgi:cytoskeletal protein RodZ
VGAFGDKFRQAREAKGISLDDVSSVTKISTRMLQAIEQEHFDQLPGGVFNKGFIRAYAKHLGLNDEDAVTSYLACLRQAQIDAQQQIWQPPSTPPPAASRPWFSEKRFSERRQSEKSQSEKTHAEKNQPGERQPEPYAKPAMTGNLRIQLEEDKIEEELPDLQLPRAEDVHPPRRDYIQRRENEIPWNIVAAIAVVIFLLAFLWIRHSHSTRTEAAATPAPAPTPAASNPASSNRALSNPTPPSQPPAHGSSTPSTIQPSTTAAAKAPANSTSNSQPNSPPTNSQAANPPAANSTTNKQATKAANPNNDATAVNDVTARTFPPAKPATPAASFTLVIRAAENSWVSITADGQSVAHENLIAPAATSVHATREIVARIGNAAGVTFLWNGQEVPAQGAESEVKTFVFDSTGMREVPNQPPAQNHPAPDQPVQN